MAPSKPRVGRPAPLRKAPIKKVSPAPAPPPSPVGKPSKPLIEEIALADHRVWYLSLVGVGVVILGASSFFAMHHTMPGWEQHMFRAVNSVHAPHWVSSQIAKPLSDAVWGLVAVMFGALLVPKFRYRAWQYVAAIGSGFVLEFLIEHLIDRGRPEALLSDAVLRAHQGGPGFPSGHVTVLTALILAIWFYVAWPWRILLGAFVIAEMWCRVFLGVHAPLDVVAGVGCGMIVVGALHLLPGSVRKLLRLA